MYLETKIRSALALFLCTSPLMRHNILCQHQFSTIEILFSSTTVQSMFCNSASGSSSIAYWNRFAIRLIHVCFYCFLIPFTLCESGIQNGDCFSCDQESYFPWVTVLHSGKKPLAILTNFLGKIVFISFPYHTLHAFLSFSLSIYINIWIVSQKYIEFHIVYAYKFPPSVCLCMCVCCQMWL